MATCKGCGASLRWIKTKAGKNMPCEANAVSYWAQIGGPDKIVTLDGEVLSCSLDGDPNKATGVGYVPHWKNCPAAGYFKGKGQGHV